MREEIGTLAAAGSDAWDKAMEEVQSGGHFEICQDGKVVAVLVPAGWYESALDALLDDDR